MDNELRQKIADRVMLSKDGKTMDYIMQLVRQSNRELLERLLTKEHPTHPAGGYPMVYSSDIHAELRKLATLQEPERKK